eukprot:6188566-Pleurochrysis_carterae.AAC.1
MSGFVALWTWRATTNTCRVFYLSAFSRSRRESEASNLARTCMHPQANARIRHITAFVNESHQQLIHSTAPSVVGPELYLISIVDTAPSENGHCEILRRDLGRIIAAGMTSKPSKSHLLRKELQLLGYIVTGDGPTSCSSY